MAAYMSSGDFILEDEFDEFSDFEDDIELDLEEDCEENAEELNDIRDVDVAESESSEQYCLCNKPPTRQMIGCIGANGVQCNHGKCFHYRCVGLTKKTIPAGDWKCKNCLQDSSTGASSQLISNEVPNTDNDKAQKEKAAKKTVRPKKKTAIPKRPESVYKHANAVHDQDEQFLECLRLAKENRSFKIGAPGREAIDLASKLIEVSDASELTQFKTSMTNVIWKALSSLDTNLNPAAYDKMLTAFNGIAISPNIVNLWFTSLNSIGLFSINQGGHILLQFTLRKYLELLMKKRNVTDVPDEPNSDAQYELTNEEQQVVRYIAGYIPYALLKIYGKLEARGNKAAGVFVKQLKSWRIDVDENTNVANFLTYTTKWTNQVNRGGLFLPKDELFLFFRCVESELLKRLKIMTVKTMRDGNMRDDLFGWVVNNIKINTSWRSLSRNLTSEYSAVLKSKMMMYWVNIRCHGYVQALVYIMKEVEAADRKGAKALRSSLVE